MQEIILNTTKDTDSEASEPGKDEEVDDEGNLVGADGRPFIDKMPSSHLPAEFNMLILGYVKEYVLKSPECMAC